MKGQTNALGNTGLIINVIADDGTFMDGQVVTVTKKETITPNYDAIDEYGVAIMDINGKFYNSASAWQAAGSPTPNGVAVSDGTHRFCIAKDIVDHVCNNLIEYPDAECWGAYDKKVSGVTTAADSATAKQDFNGVSNTDAIVANVTSSDGAFTKAPWSAAGLCHQFTFPNGSKGYLGAAGEWQMVQNSISSINTLLSAISENSIDTSTYPYYWTSTQFSSTNAYRWYVGNNNCTGDSKLATGRVRAFSEIKPITTGESKEYIVKNGMVSIPVEKNTEYTISINDKQGYITPQSITYNASTGTKHITLQYIYNPVIDLSMQDIYGNTIAQTTANCYVISKPGKYKFPLVYGNAIKNGKVNYAAFTNNGGTYSHDFVNGMGGVITGPTTSTGSNTKIYPTGMNNHIVNSDCEDGVITDINEIWEVGEDGLYYYEFTVNEVPATGGNIIFQAYGNVNDMCIWTWHIWLWPHDLSPVEITNKTGVKYNIMPVNLASKYDDDLVHIKNWFYQGGRMTPLLCPSAYNSTSNNPSGSITIGNHVTDLASGISSPTTFYKSSDAPYNWFGDKNYYNLWDAACTTLGCSDNDVVKTVYDPCPVGFKMPNGNTFTGFSTVNSIGSFTNGFKFKRNSSDTTGVFFPASGVRYSNIGSLAYVGQFGYVWTAAFKQMKEYASAFVFGEGNVYPQDGQYRSTGFSVRPVQDDNIQMDVIMINFTLWGESYQAESGMTWYEWVHSKYNVDGWYIDSHEQIVTNDGAFCVLGSDYSIQRPTDVINGLSYSVESAAV